MTRDELSGRCFPVKDLSYWTTGSQPSSESSERILPVLIPADPTDSLAPEERFTELLEILPRVPPYNNRLWLAFLTNPMPGPEESTGSSFDLAARPVIEEMSGATIAPDILHDELLFLLGFWLEMPIREYLEDLEGVGPTVAAAIRDSRPVRPARRPAPSCFLRSTESQAQRLIAQNRPPGSSAIPTEEMTILLGKLKTFAKRVHRSLKHRARGDSARNISRRDNSMPVEVAQVLYDLAGSLALCRCQARIIGLSDDRFRKNVVWVLNQSWIDARLRPVFFDALKQLDHPRSILKEG